MLYRFGEFELDEDRRELRRDGEDVAIESRILDLLLQLIRASGRVLPREDLKRLVWPDVAASDHSVNQALYGLRRALGDDPREPRYVQTLRGRGVRLIAEVASLEPPPPSPFGPTGEPPFVGREGVMAQLDEALAAADAGRGGLVLITGEPGIGKTRVLEEFRKRAIAAGHLTAMGHCPEDAGAPAFWPWIEILREVIAGEDWDRVTSGLWDDEAPRRDEARFRLFDSIDRLIGERAMEQPLLVALDDLHCADDATVALLKHLRYGLSDQKVLIVGSSRLGSASYGRVVNALGGSGAGPPAAFIQLGPLSLSDSSKLLPDREEAVAAQYHEYSGGNPFFLSQIVLATRATPPDADVDLAVAGRTVGDFVLAHLRQLPKFTRRVLGLAAVAGRDFHVSDVAAMVSGNPEEVLQALYAGVRSFVLDLDGNSASFRFRHVLLCDVLKDQLDVGDRDHAHGRLALHLIAASSSRAAQYRAAKHACRAVAVLGADTVLELSLGVARDAAKSFAFDVAQRICEEALAAVGSSPASESLLVEILVVLGESQIRRGQRAAGRATLEAAIEQAGATASGDLIGEAALALSPGFFAIETGVFDPQVVSLLEAALGTKSGRSRDVEAQLAARLAMALYWKSGSGLRRKELVEHAEALVPQSPRSRVFVSAARVVALWSADSIAARQGEVDQLIEFASASGDIELELLGRVFGVTTQLERGNHASARREIGEFSSLVEAHRLPGASWFVDMYYGMLALEAGELGRASQRISRMAKFRSVFPDANLENSIAVMTAIASWWRGDLGPLIGSIEELVDRYPAAIAWKVARGLALIDLGRIDEAREIVAILSRPGELPDDTLRVVSLTVLAHMAVVLKMVEDVPTLYSQLVAYRGRYAIGGYGVFSWGAVDSGLARLAATAGDWGAAGEFIESASLMLSEAGVRAWKAEHEASVAALLVRRGRSRDFQEARRLAQMASREAQRSGLGRVSRIARGVLDFIGDG